MFYKLCIICPLAASLISSPTPWTWQGSKNCTDCFVHWGFAPFGAHFPHHGWGSLSNFIEVCALMLPNQKGLLWSFYVIPPLLSIYPPCFICLPTRITHISYVCLLSPPVRYKLHGIRHFVSLNSSLYLQCLEVCLAYKTCSINLDWLTDWLI